MIVLFIFLTGLVTGSFLNVCIYRLPRQESVVLPGSRCTKCSKPISWYDNIPLISYILLLGKCRNCRGKIPFRYFLVEALSALTLVVFYNIFGLGIEMIFFSIFILALIAASFSDLETQIIPDEVNLGVLPLGLIFSFFNPIFQEIYSGNPLFESIKGLIIGGGMIYLTGVLGKIMFKKEAMGFGDVKLMALIGAFLGWKLVVLAYFIAPFFGLIYGLYRKIRYKDEYLPYGPFLALGAVVVLFFREKLLSLIFCL